MEDGPATVFALLLGPRDEVAPEAPGRDPVPPPPRPGPPASPGPPAPPAPPGIPRPHPEGAAPAAQVPPRPSAGEPAAEEYPPAAPAPGGFPAEAELTAGPAAPEAPEPPVPGPEPGQGAPVPPATVAAAREAAVDHLSAIRDRIMAVRSYPEVARRRGWQGRATVRFQVDGEGRARSAEVVSSSGFAPLDRAGLRAVAEGAPYPPVRGWITVPIVYRLGTEPGPVPGD